MARLDVRWFGADGVRTVDADDLPGLLAGPDGWAWVDVPRPGEEELAVLDRVFGFHPRALQDCAERNHVPKVHVYADHALLVVHAPERARDGHVHYLELDQLVGPRFVVTVHGPLNPAVPLELALRETARVAERIGSGRSVPRTPVDLAYTVVTAVVRHERDLVGAVAEEVGRLEQLVMAGDPADPEEFLNRLYRARHVLLTIRTMAVQTHQVYGRAVRLATFLDDDGRRRLDDLADQYARVRHVTDGQLAFVHGVTEFFRARTDTKMTIAAERLAVIAALTLPITALSSVLGMNLIVNGETRWGALAVVVAAMSGMSLWLLRWARAHGWW